MANFQLQDNFKVPFSVIELDSDNNPTGGQGDTATVVSSDTASLTVVLDPTPAPGSIVSGFLVGGTKLQVGVAVTVTTSHADGSPVGQPVVDMIDIVAGAGVSAGISLGTPIPQ